MSLKEIIKLIKGKNFIKIKVIPNSAKTEFVGFMENGFLKMKVRGIPERGKVNEELIRFISKEIGIDKKNIQISSGKTAKIKTIKIIL